MITAHLVRSGIHSKYMRPNRGVKGIFTKRFPDVEALVHYMRSQHGSVYFAPDSGVCEKDMKLFVSKSTAMHKKSYPSIDRKIDKEISRRRSYYGFI